MPDISMCRNIFCPLKDSCYRYLAEPGFFQSYASFKPDEKGNCDFYWPIEIDESKEIKNDNTRNSN